MNCRTVRAIATACLLPAIAWLPIGAADADVDAGLRRLAGAHGQGAPLFRIGLESDHALEVSARGAFRVVDPATGKDVWRESYRGTLAVVAEGGPTEGVPSVFRIQVAAIGERQRAESELQSLKQHYGVPGIVRYVPDRDSWRVRLGEAEDREGLATLMERLRADGRSGIWIVEEPREAHEGVRLRLVDASYESHSTGLSRVAVVPVGRTRVAVEGTAYRGAIELRVSTFGTVQAINWVQLENYLLGVVPAELGPEVWPELEALKAQAVAARTYAWRHRGQFADEGFDLCGTPRCQVYKGVPAEHPLSDRAIHETRAEILTWKGEPITALYTATCGGHTEDAGEIFPEERAPYLVGVPCRAEQQGLDQQRVELSGRRIEPVIAEDGADVTREVALLHAAGVIDDAELRPTVLRAPASAEQLRRWTAGLAALSGRPVPTGPAREPRDLGTAALALVEDLGWDERAQVLIAEADLQALLRDTTAGSLPEDQRRALGYLVLAEAIRPFPDGSYGLDGVPSGARLLAAMARIGEVYDAFGVGAGTVGGKSARGMRIVVGKGELRVALSPALRLFALGAGRPSSVGQLSLWPGDRIRFRRDAGGQVDFLELAPPVKGTSDDRSAKLYSWEVRRSRRQLEQAINRRVSVGRLADLRVLRRGVSGRVVELEVVGSKGTDVVRGFDIRRLLGLRESLVVIEIQRDPDGRLEGAVFAGKGWGHGVGLCQVGAYGMALRDSGYREILGHYYRGAELATIPGM